MLHPILDDHPAWRALQDRRARAETARRQALEAAGGWEARYHAAKREHDAAVERATAGEGPPPPAFEFADPKPDAGAILTRITAEQTTIRDAERDLLRRHGPELHAELADREDVLVDEIRTAVEKVARKHADTLDELDALARAGAALARANGHRGQLRERATLADVVAAVLEGGRLVADLPGTPQPPPPAPPGTGAETRARMDAARAGFAASRSPAAAALRGRR